VGVTKDATKDISMCQEVTVLTASEQKVAKKRALGIDDRPFMEIQMSLAIPYREPLRFVV
jgi:hypothetical protein